MKTLCMGCMEEYDDQFDVCPHCGYIKGTPAKEAYHIAPGSILEQRYIVGRVLGFGGFGITYIGYDKLLEHKVAIKEYMPSEFSTRMPDQQYVTIYSGEREEQFKTGLQKVLDEAKRLAKFQSEPGIVHIFDCFEANNTAYIIMEYLDGESLKEKLDRDGKMTVDEAMPVILSVLSALKKVHAVGIIHRDIAPDNIYLLKNGEVKLLDFGAARYATTKHSKSLSVIIKPGYAPEEQYRSRGDQGPWTDVYALSATLYKMITGIRPEDAMERGIKDELKKPSKLGVKIEKSTETAIMNALNIKIEERTQSAEEFETELLAAEVTEKSVRHEKNDVGKVPGWVKVVSGISAAVVLLFMVLLATGVISFDISGTSALSIPDGQTRVPNVVGTERNEAENRIKEANLSLVYASIEASDEIGPGKILRQDVKSGTIVDEGTVVALTMSSGKGMARVPDLIGLTKADADKALAELELQAEYSEENAWTTPGTIAKQDIIAGAEIEKQELLKLTLSSGQKGGDGTLEVSVPDLAGMNSEKIESEMQKVHLYYGKSGEEYNSEIPKGAVIRQSPKAGGRVFQNSSIQVVLSLGKELIDIPNLEMQKEADAAKMLEALGLQANIQYEADAQYEAGVVIRQDEKDNAVEKGSVITFYVSTGAPVTEPPKETKAKQPANTKRQNTPTQSAQPTTQPPATETAPPQTEAPRTEPETAATKATTPTKTPDPVDTRLNDLGNLGL